MKDTVVVRDVDFVTDRYFFLDHPEGAFFLPSPEHVEVFISVTIAELMENPYLHAFPGRAFVDTLGRGLDIKAAMAAVAAGKEPQDHERALFRLLGFGNDFGFMIDPVSDSALGVRLSSRIEDFRVLAVRYINEIGDTIGNYRELLTANDTLFLELIKPRDPRPSGRFAYTWKYMMRNIYDLHFCNINATTLEIEIEDLTIRPVRTQPEGEDVPYLRIFGLDRCDEAGFHKPDGKIDLFSGFVDLQQCILIFPTLRPFDPPIDSVEAWTALDASFVVPDDYEGLANSRIYDEWLSEHDRFEANKYNIIIRAPSNCK